MASKFLPLRSKKLYVVVLVIIFAAGIVAMRMISTMRPPMAFSQEVEVKAMQVIQKDTPIGYQFVGKVISKNEVKIMSKVSGNITEKMVKGGDTVTKGQPLFRIDNKQYISAINNSRATLAKAQASLYNSQRELARYRPLAAMQGVSQETLDSYEAQAKQDAATVEANQASLQQAIEDEQDTLIVSPVDGRIDVNDVSVGQYVTAGSTTMATVSSLDPIWVQFSMSENEYIKFVRLGQGTLPASFKNNLRLLLSDGSEYSLAGQVEQIDKGMSDSTGTITLKASFANPQRFLVPNMFAKVIARGEIKPGAILVPQRAVTELLDSYFVTVVTLNNTAENRQVKLGEKVGSLWVVEEGLSPGDVIVVEGIDKVKDGSKLKVDMTAPEEYNAPDKQ